MKEFFRIEDARSLWNIMGSFGVLSTEVEKKDGGYSAENDKIRATFKITDEGHGVYSRRGSVTNISDKPVTLRTLSSKFVLGGGEYDVYSQLNCWQNESRGSWQPLVTTVESIGDRIRNTVGATPFMALWNNQTGRGYVFHIIAYSTWKMKITKAYRGGVTATEVDLGVLSDNFAYELGAGESVDLPEILFYETTNRTDLDCWKLHGMLNEKYPRRITPVVYNSWLYKFDRFSFDDLVAQAEKAAMLGVEYFMVDAGWFGVGSAWWGCRGDWDENMTYGFCGRMQEFAEVVRAKGMKLGFWLEPECASEESNIIKEHPEYFLPGEGSMFLDFANPDARDYIFNKTCQLIDKYGAEYIKFDFNADKLYDERNHAFMNYFRGHAEYLKRLRNRYPDIYLENCAGGGSRMSIRDGLLCDSFWLSDNQGPYYSNEIFKNTMLRLPPQWIERWATIRSAENFTPEYETGEYVEKIIATNDATWSNVIGINKDYLKGFLTGSPIGLSCDLTALSEDTLTFLKEHIAEFKKNREFWKKTVGHILTDTNDMLVLQFRSEDFSRSEIVVFKNHALQDSITVYPVVCGKKTYEVTGMGTVSGEQLMTDGIDVALGDYYTAEFVSVCEK